MLLKNLTTAIVVTGLAIAPITVHAGPLGTIGASDAGLRTSAPAEDSSELAGGGIFLLLGLAVVGVGVVAYANSDDDESEVPPISF